MLRRLSAAHRSRPLAAPFRISRGVKTSAEVIEVRLHDGDGCGRGESVPYARYGETIDSVLEQIERARPQLEAGADRGQLRALLPPGAARNALDAALWDLEAGRGGGNAIEPPRDLVTAITVGIDSPARMRAAAEAVAHAPLIKVKVDATAPDAQIAAVRAGAPDARLIVDPNESWDYKLLCRMQPLLERADVALLEQPLPADMDYVLEGFSPSRPICADESCHVAADLPRLATRYQAVNIKLDKTGGLTEALELLDAARAAGFQIMVGCMVCSSLGIAPALRLAPRADFIDLDGPWWLREDDPDGARFQHGLLLPPSPGFWG
ncbi:dipeptide epimerase [Lysobacter maris]|uniref:Dipeptide epimerase n=1 Tax=Marilutibacter maris TaxID=1605891 RepID=A0A508B8J7_9GAMM|nr:N-acetyl-D-Glu racemase DgcA [Lysobacter maris]KAB8196194.1 dipeptide epimerase [Lysobacter maris]